MRFKYKRQLGMALPFVVFILLGLLKTHPVLLLNRCSLIVLRATADITVTGNECADADLPSSMKAQQQRLAGELALRRHEYLQAIHFLQLAVGAAPDALLAHFRLAEAYHAGMAASLAGQEYRWLEQRLGSFSADKHVLRFVTQRAADNDRLARLQSGQALTASGARESGLAVLRSLAADEDSISYLANYYLYRAYLGQDEASAKLLLPKLAYFPNPSEPRLQALQHSTFSDTLPPLINAHLWDLTQVEDLEAFLYWQGDRESAQRLNVAVRSYAAALGAPARTAVYGVPVGACTSYIARPAVSDTSQEGGSASSDWTYEPSVDNYCESSAGQSAPVNLVKNGDFEVRDKSMPANWFFARSVVRGDSGEPWRTDPRFLPFGGADSVGVCDGENSARLQVLWQKPDADGLFAAFSQEVTIPRPDEYVFGVCYAQSNGQLGVTLAQDERRLLDVRLPLDAEPCACVRIPVVIEDAIKPVYFTIAYRGVGWARLDKVLLQPSDTFTESSDATKNEQENH